MNLPIPTSTLPVLTCMLLALAGSPIHAQTADTARAEKARAQLQKRFTKADTNADGQLSREEAKTGMPRVYKQFDRIDTANTGSITMDQIAGFAAQQRQR